MTDKSPLVSDPQPSQPPKPDYDTVQVDAGTGPALHEIELDEAMEEEVQPENQPLEERDA